LETLLSDLTAIEDQLNIICRLRTHPRDETVFNVTLNKIEFEKSVLRAIDLQLKQVFGETATMIIYNYLQTAVSLQQEDIPAKLEIFTDGLNKFLSSGAIVVERIILENLYYDLGREFEVKEGYRLPDYVNELKEEIRKTVPK
jgi:hypothetical protein